MVRAGSLIAVATLWSAPAVAWTGTVDWPTFYRAGPDKGYTVLQEMQRGQTVEVLSCQGDWCRVQNGRSIGYIKQAALASPPAPSPSPVRSSDCFDSRSAGYEKGEVFRYCRDRP